MPKVGDGFCNFVYCKYFVDNKLEFITSSICIADGFDKPFTNESIHIAIDGHARQTKFSRGGIRDRIWFVSLGRLSLNE